MSSIALIKSADWAYNCSHFKPLAISAASLSNKTHDVIDCPFFPPADLPGAQPACWSRQSCEPRGISGKQKTPLLVDNTRRFRRPRRQICYILTSSHIHGQRRCVNCSLSQHGTWTVVTTERDYRQNITQNTPVLHYYGIIVNPEYTTLFSRLQLNKKTKFS